MERCSLQQPNRPRDRPQSGQEVPVNGEIYNHEELRKRMVNHKFRTGSDCDVIAHLYEEYGENFVDMLDRILETIASLLHAMPLESSPRISVGVYTAVIKRLITDVSFGVPAYMGNPELCGPPLPDKCPDQEEPAQNAAIPVTLYSHIVQLVHFSSLAE
ncbi:hypothetical protein Dsin_024412 [Dipteronia sinensis]|uniref:Glutamine amidotransferase type-2 domain-containing protein n=1 Tax=Dipteronia sinensis TaxID=43782 RepID=A0AAD9ZTY5_9ROSI|nr:hypothetical protein Dsin_024412 [Dipteronia sinensis]